MSATRNISKAEAEAAWRERSAQDRGWLLEHVRTLQHVGLDLSLTIDAALALLRAAAEPEAKDEDYRCSCLRDANTDAIKSWHVACPLHGDEVAPKTEPEAKACKRCGKPLAYAGAVYCGAGCSARAEAAEPEEKTATVTCITCKGTGQAPCAFHGKACGVTIHCPDCVRQ